MIWKSCTWSNRERHGEYVRCCTEEDEPLKEKNSNLFLSSLWFLFGLWLLASLTNTFLDEILDENNDLIFANSSMKFLKRSKRFVYMSSNRTLNLPPGSKLDLEPTISTATGLNPLPPGFGSETALSIPFDVDLDELGYTSTDNRFGEIPFLTKIIDYFEGLDLKHKDRMVPEFTQEKMTPESTQKKQRINSKLARMHISKGGGERPIMYQVLEDTLYNLGIDGKACLLRAICEVHAESLFGHGLFGEVLELFLSVSSSSNYLHVLGEYLAAEMKGKSVGNCSQYKEKCPLSIFGALSEKQLKHERHIRKRFIEDESNYAHYHKEGEHNGIRITKDHIYNMEKNTTAMKTLSRQKRFFFFGPAGRLTFPLGTIVVWKPQLHLPWMTNLPDGYSSGLSIGIPVRFIFDDLGLSSTLNPFLRLPFLSSRRKRDTWKPLPGVNYDGGDRELLYVLLEHTLEKWGLNGKTCMLRAVCEMNLMPFTNHGFFGEMVQLFLTPSKSPHALLRMREYCDAEELGRTAKYCKPYHEGCPHSIFISYKEKERRIADMKSRASDEEEMENWV